MERFRFRLLIFLAVSVGGGSLALLGWFLTFGALLDLELFGSTTARLAWDAVLCVAFFLQHSGMIRRGAKTWLARWIPSACYPAWYSIASGVVLAALVLLWQPTGDEIWAVGGAGRWLLFAVSVAALAGFAWGAHSLRDLDPFGSRALQAEIGRAPHQTADLVARGPYRYVRHPLYLFVLVLLWATPSLSTDRLLFNGLWTAWIVLGTLLEERDLVADYGEAYRRYQGSVPMLIPSPRLFRGRAGSTPGPGAGKDDS